MIRLLKDCLIRGASDMSFCCYNCRHISNNWNYQKDTKIPSIMKNVLKMIPKRYQDQMLSNAFIQIIIGLVLVL